MWMRRLLLLVLMVWGPDRLTAAPRIFPPQSGIQWAPFLEWVVPNETYEGNPFDLSATVVFQHEESGARNRTGMFYAGSGYWKFRFCGTRPGLWTFATVSVDPDLNGYRGTVLVEPNDHGYGFVHGRGGKWVREFGREGSPKAFAPQFVMYAQPGAFAEKPEIVERDIRTFLGDHGFTGFHVPVYCRWFDIQHDRSDLIITSDPNPDHRTFAALEGLISQVHAAGGVVHLWAWGDESRRQTPVKWGINGTADVRLQRYIAARLGPLPGWTMGYGFDLDEWVTGKEIAIWRDRLHEEMGWSHLLGGRHGDPNQGLNHAAAIEWNRSLDYAGYEHHRPTPQVYAAAQAAIPELPVFSEDRFRIRQSDRYRAKDYDETMTRRGLWHAMMSGGVANIWGRMDGDLGINPGQGASNVYAHPEWIKTWSIFFANRFTEDCFVLPGAGDALALGSARGDRILFYVEGSDSVPVGAIDENARARMIAVDTKQAYEERELDPSEIADQAWQAPYKSDWAVAVEPHVEPYPRSELVRAMHLNWSTHRRSAQGSDNFQLTWADDGHLYGAWGDGGGFGGSNGRGRVGLGVARVEGGANDYQGVNLWGGFDSQREASFPGKSWGMLGLAGRLYQWVVPDVPEGKTYRNHYEYVELAQSADNGLSWEKLPWRFEEHEELTIPTFLNAGQGYSGLPDSIGKYVYTYFIGPQTPSLEQAGPRGQGLIVHKPGRIFLARVALDAVASGRHGYDFYQGMSLEGEARWGPLASKQAVFENARGVGWCLSVSFNPALQRFILATEHDISSQGRLGFFGAPTPWGPWRTLAYFESDAPFGVTREGSPLPWRRNVFFASFPTKWLSGNRFVLSFTGAGNGRDNDSFNTVEGWFERF